MHVWWSADGLSFQPIDNDNIVTNIQPTAHNLSMSGNELGHAEMGANEFISYSYTGSDGKWGLWNAWLNPIQISGAGWTGANTLNGHNLTLTSILMLLLGE